MGASAGRVLIIPKGNWNAETTYTGLDMVRYNGASWVCKNTCTNIVPSAENANYWQMVSRDGTDITVDSEVSDESANPVQNKVIKKYVDEHTPEIADMTGATTTQNGAHGLVPEPQAGDEKKALLGDGTWGSVDAIFTYKTKEEYDAAVASGEIPDGAKVIKEYDEGETPVIIGVDTAMSDDSTNPVQNKVIKKYVDDKKVNVDGLTITLDEARNVIKLADTLKDKIGTALQPESIANNQTTTEAGFALDARQANPNVEGTLGKLLSDLTGNLNTAFYALKETKDANDAEPGLSHMPANSNNDTSTHNPFPIFHTILLTVPFVELTGGYAIQLGISIASQYNGKLAVRTKDSNNWSEWSILSDINDVNNVAISDVSSKLDTTHMTGSITYATFGRVTMVWFDILPIAKADNVTILPAGTIPKAYGYAYHSMNSWGESTVPDSLMAVRDDGSLGFWTVEASVNHRIFDSFMYFSKP